MSPAPVDRRPEDAQPNTPLLLPVVVPSLGRLWGSSKSNSSEGGAVKSFNLRQCVFHWSAAGVTVLLNSGHWRWARKVCSRCPCAGRSVPKRRIHGDRKGISGCQGLPGKGGAVTANEGSFQEQKGSAQELFNSSVGGQCAGCRRCEETGSGGASERVWFISVRFRGALPRLAGSSRTSAWAGPILGDTCQWARRLGEVAERIIHLERSCPCVSVRRFYPS